MQEMSRILKNIFGSRRQAVPAAGPAAGTFKHTGVALPHTKLIIDLFDNLVRYIIPQMREILRRCLLQ